MSPSSITRPRRLTVTLTTLVPVLIAALLVPPAASATHSWSAPSFGTSLRAAAPVGDGPSAVAVDPDTDTAYVSNGQNPNGNPVLGNTVSVIDTRRCNAESVRSCPGPWPTVTVGNEPSAVAVDRRTHTVYVTNIDDNTVSVVDGRTCNGGHVSGCDQTPATVPVGEAPAGVFVDPGTRSVYVANFSAGTVSVLDAATCNGTNHAGCPSTLPPAFDVGDGPGDVDVNPRTHTAYVSTLTGFSAFDTHACNASSQSGCGRLGDFTICDGCFGPFSAKVDVDHNTIYEADGQTSVEVIDGGACNAANLSGCARAQHGTIALPDPGFDHILWFALDPGLHTLYATMQKNDTVIAIDTDLCNGHRTGACRQVEPLSVHVGTDPQGVGINTRTHTLYVANQLDDTVSVVDTRHCNADTTSGCRHRSPLFDIAPTGTPAADATTNTLYIPTDHTSITMVDMRACQAHHATGCRQDWPSVEVGANPAAVTVDAATHTAYVADHGRADGTGRGVAVLDTDSCQALESGCSVVATVNVTSGQPTSIAVNPKTHAVYVGAVTPDGANTVSMVTGTACSSTITTGCDEPLAVMQDGPARGPAIHCGAWTVGVAVNPATDTVYATSTEACGGIGEEVFVFNGATCEPADTSGCGAPKATVEAGLNPYSLAVDPNTNMVYTPLLGDGETLGRVAVIDGRTCNGTTTSGCAENPVTAPAEFGSLAIDIDPRTGFVYVADIENTSVSIIDGHHCNGTDTDSCHQQPRNIPVDDYPDSLAVAPSADTAYVTSSTKGTISLIPLRRR
jgi:DNA-binding beta-propeller fold protein YncE